MEIPKGTFLPIEKQGPVRSLLKDYYLSLTRHLSNQRQQLQTIHSANQRTLHTRGELSQERKDQLQSQQVYIQFTDHHVETISNCIDYFQYNYDRLLSGAQNFAEVLGEELGEIGEPITNPVAINSDGGSLDVIIKGGDGEPKFPANDPWQDEDTRSFYTSLPDVKVFLPNYQPTKEVTAYSFIVLSKILLLLSIITKTE